VFQVMLNPFSKGFKVTPKGTQSDRARFNWTIGTPIVVLFILNAISLWLNFGRTVLEMNSPTTIPGLSLGWIWSSYNLVILGVTLLVLLDLPQPDIFQWYSLQRIVRLDLGDREAWGFTTRISEVGLELTINKADDYARELVESQAATKLTLVEENIQAQGIFSKVDLSGDVPRLQIKFTDLSTEQHRQFVQLLYCRPGQWLSRKAPGELQSLLLLARILLGLIFCSPLAIDAKIKRSLSRRFKSEQLSAGNELRRSRKRSPTRKALAIMVRAGLTLALAGKKLPSTT